MVIKVMVWVVVRIGEVKKILEVVQLLLSVMPAQLPLVLFLLLLQDTQLTLLFFKTPIIISSKGLSGQPEQEQSCQNVRNNN